ncbi:MAG: hypothetical protein ABEL76_01075, partial [Bradymonadaceae bacterium]
SVMPLTDVQVRAYPTDQFECDNFQPLADDQPDTGDHETAPSAGKTVSFSDLDARKSYTVTAVARGNRGQIAGGGCDQKIDVPDGSVATKELLLHLVPLQPAGQYSVTSHWDFSKAVSKSGAVGKNVVRILDIFKNPGDAIYREVINLVENFVSGLAGKTIDWVLDKTGLDQRFKDMINRAVQQNDALCRIREVGRDLRDVLANLTVHSELTIGQLRSNYEFQGRNNWVGITLYWRGMCKNGYEDACSGKRDRNDPKDRKKACAAIQLKADANGKIGSLGVLSSKWTGRVTAYNQLQIDKHPLPLKYGKFVEYVLNQIILPELTNGNAHSLSGAFSYWVGCGSLASSVTGSDGKVCAPQPVKQCLTDNDVKNFCKSAISTLFGAADLVIGELEYETGIEVGGEATLVETTSDGRVDYLEDGTYSGHVDVQGKGKKTSGGQSNISATWKGQRMSSGTSN